MAVPIYIPTNSAHTILFFTTLLTFFVFLLTVILTGMKQHSHFISLMISDAEYLFIHQLTICMSYTENFQNLHPFLNQIVCGFCFWMLSCMGACFPDGSEGKESACNV